MFRKFQDQATVLVRILLTCIMLAGVNRAIAQETSRPNIVLIIGDDHGYPYFGFTGSPHVHTPHLDELARNGALFKLGHTTDNHCRPALQTLVTGLHPAQYTALSDSLRARDATVSAEYATLDLQGRQNWDFMHRAHVMRQFVTLPRLLAEEGYASFQAGKWWEQSYANGGFTDGMSKGWEEARWGQAGFFHDLMGGEGIALVRETMQPVYDFIDRHTNTPFFLWYGPSLPHTPLNPPQEHYSHYVDTNLSESAKEYYGNCTWFDAGVGDLLDYLETRGLTERTLVIYVNDNGWEQPPFAEYKDDHILYSNGGPNGKLSIHDQAFRTPIILSWPGMIDSKMFSDALVSSVDLVPTILDYAGLPLPEYMPGESLRPVIEGRQSWLREILVGRVTQMRSETDVMGRPQEGYYVRTKRWHFTWTGDQMQLFDMAADPLENVLPDFPELVPVFKTRIEEWRRSQDGALPWPAVRSIRQ